MKAGILWQKLISGHRKLVVTFQMSPPFSLSAAPCGHHCLAGCATYINNYVYLALCVDSMFVFTQASTAVYVIQHLVDM